MLEEHEIVVLAQEKWLDLFVKVLLEKTVLLDSDHHGCEWSGLVQYQYRIAIHNSNIL